MKTNQMILFVAAILIVGGAAFYGGIKYQESKNNSFFRTGFMNGNASGSERGGMMGSTRGGQTNMRMGFRPVNGEIIASDDTSITVKLQDGSSRIVLVTDKTSINKAESASKEDLKTGETVAVFGITNTDGSVSAQNIQLNPVLRMTDETPPSVAK